MEIPHVNRPHESMVVNALGTWAGPTGVLIDDWLISNHDHQDTQLALDVIRGLESLTSKVQPQTWLTDLTRVKKT